MKRPWVTLLLQCTAGALVTSMCVTETAFAAGPMEDNASGGPAKTVTLAAGTVVPLTLINPVHSKSSKAGDEVRAQVAFPVSVGAQVAIPPGAYVEGTLVSAAPATRKAPATLKVHFTRLIFASGYTVALDAVNTATLDEGVLSNRELAANLPPPYYPYGRGARFYGPDPGFYQVTFPGQTPTTAPPLSNPGPSKGLIIGLMVGTTAAMIALSAIFWHHRNGQIARMDTVLFDAGWQFDMKLDKPLELDAAKAGTMVPGTASGAI